MTIFLTAGATRRYVWEGANGLGNSWGGAMGDLKQAINASVPGDEIWVAVGTYKPNKTGSRFEPFFLKEGVKIYGGFGGYETSINERLWPNEYQSLLSGDIDATGDFDSFHVLRSPADNSTLTNATVVDGFTITGGRADYPDAANENALGGGVYLEGNASPVFTHCIFTNNTARIAGAIYAKGSGTIQLSGCEFFDNPILGNPGELRAINIFTGGISVAASDCYFQSAGSGDNHSIFLTSESGNLVQHTFSFRRCIFKESGTHYGIVESCLGGKDTTWLSNCVFDGSDAGANPVLLNFGNSFFKITNSTFYQYDFGLNVSYPSKLANNIFWGCGVYKESSSAATPNITRNIIQSGNATCYNCPGAVDPLFVNAADPDGADNKLGTADDGLLIYSNSPAVKAGLSGPDFERPDIKGDTYDGPLNLGAYQGSVCLNGGITRLYVNAAVSGGNGSGTSWQNAMPHLRTALNTASGCSGIKQIWVARGTYKTSTIGDRDQSFYLRDSLAVYGGFAGTETNLIQRNPKRNVTILSGDIDAGGSGDAFTVLNNINLDNSAVIDGFTITGGYNENGSGAGIKNGNADPIITNCTISGNYAAPYGGGMYNGNSSPTVIGCTFYKNTAAERGGAVYNGNATSPQMRNCLFVSNSTPGYGGAVHNVLNTASNKLINCTFYYNSATLGGGGVYNNIASPTITNCIFWKNGGLGEEITNNGISSPTVSYSYIQGGYAPCTNCTDYTQSPKFIDSSVVIGPQGQNALQGADGVFGTPDDGLQLDFTSPCINAGNNSEVVDVFDIMGDKRISGTNVNLGAYETIAIGSKQNGNWNEATTWTSGSVPFPENRVMINPTHTVTIPAAYKAYCKSIWLRTGGVKPGGQLVIPVTSQLRLKQ